MSRILVAIFLLIAECIAIGIIVYITAHFVIKYW